MTRGRMHDDEADIDELLVRRLLVALIALPYYRSSNVVFADLAKHMIDEVVADAR